MNQQQPDNFFREKLRNYQKPAPQGAWNKIESALEKKTERKFVWWKVAAVLFLIAGAGYLFLVNINDPDQQHLTAEKQLDNILQNAEKPKSQKNVEQIKPEKSDKTELSDKVKTNDLKVERVEQVEKHSPKLIEKEKPAEDRVQDIDVKEDIRLAQELPVQSDSPTVESPEKGEKRSTITLTFSSDQTSQYLNKNAIADATSTDKKPSNLKKLLQKANDLKSNQDPFGDLRERKNEILALSFKNDKRGQNK